VGECKWWSGPKAAGEALDQLLGYVPWRDEKAALILFIDRVNATAAVDAAAQAIIEHDAHLRAGPTTSDPSARRNFVLSSPSDSDREIHLALLVSVIR
jgi:hypothetical protein